MNNKYLERIAKKDTFDEALSKLKGMVEEAKSDPQKMENLNKAFMRTRTAGTSPQKARD